MRLEGSVALVTGGSHGIGKTVVRRLLEEGAAVAFCAREAAGLSASASDLAAIGGGLFPCQADVTDEASVNGLVAKTLERFGRIDVLVNNAGIYGPIGPVWENDPRHWRQTIETNLFGTFLVSHAVLPAMIEAGRGKVINMSGGGAATPFPRYSAYAASKAAVIRLTETLAAEVAEHNIQVNAVAPGFVATRLHEDTLNAGSRAGAEFLWKTREELDKGGVSPEVVAGLVAFLASSEADWITGRFIHAVWDGWAEFGRHREEITKTDLFTLRRIVPTDRGMSWR